jgi:phosphate transport system substrate-binding protein
MNKKNIKQFLSDAKAVSPAIATLILIVVAAVAAAGIGILVSHSQGSSKEMLDTKTASVQGKIVSDGSTTVLPVTLLAGPVFMENFPSYSIQASGGGSDVGREDVMNKKVDIGASSAKWPDTETPISGYSTPLPARKDIIIQEGGASATIWETRIGTGMIVVAANINNGAIKTINITNGATSDINYAAGTANITFNDLKTAYQTGTLTVSTQAIKLFQREDVSGTEETFAAWLGAPLVGSDKQLVSPVDGKQGNQGVTEAISATNNSLGFVDVSFSTVGTVVGVNSAANVYGATMNGVPALEANKGVGNKYDAASITVNGATKGLARDLFYYSYGTPTGAVKAFLDFMLSSDGQNAVHKAGFFSTS